MNTLTRYMPQFLCWLLLLPAVQAVAAPMQHSFNELINKEVLFGFYQGHNFPAISRLLMVKKENQLTTSSDEYELLLAGLYLSFDLDSEAKKIFDRHLSGSEQINLRNQALLLLAKVEYENGLYAKAEKTLKKVKSRLTPAQQEERLLMHGQLLLKRGKHRWSTARLQKIKNDSKWAIYGRYNLGIALLKLQDNQGGQKLLAAIGQMKASSEEMWILRDRANLALGFWFLERRRSEDALLVLKRIRLNSPVTSMGLLGTGWAHERQAEFQTALSIWKKLLENDISDPAVQEAHLSSAEVYLKLGAERQGIEQYQHAIKLYQKEISRLDKNIASLKPERLFDTSTGQITPPGKEWINRVSSQQAIPENIDLKFLLNNHQFLGSLASLQDLLSIAHSLRLWSLELGEFKNILHHPKKQTINAKIKTIERERSMLNAQYDKQLQSIENRPKAITTLDISSPSSVRIYKDMLLDIDIKGENRHIVTGDERILLSKRKTHLKKLRTFSKNKDNLKKHYPIFEKIVAWNGSTLHLGLSAPEKTLSHIEQQLLEVEKRWQAMQMLLHANSENIRPFSQQITQSIERTDKLRLKLSSVIKRQIDQFSSTLTNELQVKKRRLEGYLIRAHFGTARIQDRALGTKEIKQ